jgi:glycosyltransferase involved in cell wall biosynthesis
MTRLGFVLEQTLGHVAHSRNIERVLSSDAVDAEVVHVDYASRTGWRRLPGVGTWTVKASLDARRAVRRMLQTGSVQAVFVHTQVAALALPDLMRRLPVVVSLDATPANFDAEGEAYGHRRGEALQEAVKRGVNRTAMRGARALVTWCGWAAASLEHDYGLPPERIHVIHPGVDLSLFKPRASENGGGPLRILFVGGDFERKGGYDLLDAVQPLTSAVELHLVTGSEVRLPAGVKAVVHRGLRPQSDELLELYATADVFALPSRGDCFPQAVAEALASGLPVVATDVGAIPEMVEPGRNGFLIPRGGVADLSAALSRLVTDGALRRAMGVESLALARAEHDATANNRRIVELLSDLAEGWRQPVTAGAAIR